MRALVTGAGGFIGGSVVTRLLSEGYSVTGFARTGPNNSFRPGLSWHSVDDLNDFTGWRDVLEGVDVVVHCAGKTYLPNNAGSAAVNSYELANVELTRRLARNAAEAGVRRMVFLSSVKAVGESSLHNNPLSIADARQPEDLYGISKCRAEMLLRDFSVNSGFEVVIVRPPIVYGPCVKGNFLRLMSLVARGIPLPLGAVDNARSMVFIDNLVDFLYFCASSPAAANKTFFVSDGHDLSTRNLIRELGDAMGCRARIFPVPSTALKLLGRLTGKSAEIQRLIGTLQVDITPNRELGWVPPYSVQHGLVETARWFINRS